MTISMSGLDYDSIEWTPPKEWRKKPQRGDTSKRSDLAFPHISLDRTEYKCPSTGKWITSKNGHREHLKVNDFIEVGNDSNFGKPKSKAKTTDQRNAEIRERRDDIDKAVAMYKEGYRNAPVQSADDVGIVAPSTGGPARSVPKKEIIKP
jgi:hypothetical protein